jgi:5-methylcytosine-specific restriction endonuclease McrA
MFQELQEPQEPMINAEPSLFFPSRARKPVSNPKFFRTLISETIKCAEDLKQKEFDFILSLQKLDQYQGYKHIGYRSLTSFCVQALKFPVAQSLTYVMVARKAVECDKLQEALRKQEISPATARKILSVLTPENQEHWLNLSMTLTTRNLEKEISKISPKDARPDQMRYVGKDTLRYEVNVSEGADQDFRRAKELICEKMGRGVSFDEVLGLLAREYVERRDPMRKAQRAIQKNMKRIENTVHVNTEAAKQDSSATAFSKVTSKKLQRRKPIPAQARNEVFYRDQGQCTHKDLSGERCDGKIFLHIHHKTPVSEGGGNEPENLELLCSWHHQRLHEDLVH